MIGTNFRRRARAVRRELSVLKYRLKCALGSRDPAKIVSASNGGNSAINHPVVGIVAPPGVSSEQLTELMSSQTEMSWTQDPAAIKHTPYLWCPGDAFDELEACHLESLILTAAAQDLDVVVGGWAAPEDQTARPHSLDQGSLTLLRRPAAEPSAGPVRGTQVSQITQETPEAPVMPPTSRSGNFMLNHLGESGAVIRLPLHNVDVRLAGIPEVPGPPTVLFLAPYLAVGGAENLLFDLIEGLTPEHRVLVATLDPHRKELGQTVDRCRQLTPHVYTLGDWIPREARIDALKHLLRRWCVKTLVSWNGTVDFYDHALQLKRCFPELRVLAQLYNHEGGWIDRMTPSLLTQLNGHLAINDRISRALVNRGAPPDRVFTVHHGVDVPSSISEEERAVRRRAKRVELGIPAEAMVVGTFIRLHPQKRPLDVVRLARRLRDSGFHFLLVGGGPEEERVDAEIESAPSANLHRLPLQTETTHLYDALDVCLLTSDYEGLPVFLLDGLAREIPCVATAVGEIPELLKDGGGILVETPGDLDSLADGLALLEDPDRRRLEGQRGRKTVEDHFGLHKYVSAYKDLIFPELHK